MIDFQHVALSHKEDYERLLMAEPERGCDCSFANLYLWGRQNLAFRHGCVLRFSHIYGKSVYPYPFGQGDRQAAIADLLRDAQERGIPCRLTSMTSADAAELEALFPGKFYIQADRDGFDYVYDINDLSDLRGRKYMSKRNHFNRFCIDYPQHRVVPMTRDLLPAVTQFAEDWYSRRRQAAPTTDYLLENVALARMFRHFSDLSMEGTVLMDGSEILAFAVGSRLSADTFDIHFEKAREDIPGAYTAIACHFARYLRLQHPELKFLNREDDMGLEGLRQAKLGYRPHHLLEKYWAVHKEELHVY